MVRFEVGKVYDSFMDMGIDNKVLINKKTSNYIFYTSVSGVDKKMKRSRIDFLGNCEMFFTTPLHTMYRA